MVPEERLELSHLAVHDFESCASTSSATPAQGHHTEKETANPKKTLRFDYAHCDVCSRICAMKQYETFIFESYAFDSAAGEILLNYSLDGEVQFTEKLTLQKEGLFPGGVDEELLNRALFMLHLIGGISYYKTCCPKSMEIRSGSLTQKQAEFWNTVYKKGLGEFFYRNDMDFEGLIDFPYEDIQAPEALPIEEVHNRTLVPIGGGKDSIVTAELLKSAGMECALFRMGNHPLIEQAVEVANLPLISVERSLGKNLFTLNEEGALNGHIPITAYLSCLTVVTALLYGFDFIAMSNERSANEGNFEWKGHDINHQWSKSQEFEKMFQNYVHEYLTRDLDYFSLLRGMSELLIAEQFASHPKYFSCATSCNANWRIVKDRPQERWCNTCPKCAFAFSQFAAFLPREQLMSIFGANLYDKEELLPLYKQLLGMEGFKPFECVGTPEETAAAMVLALTKREMENTPVIQMFLREKAESISQPDALVGELLTPTDDHTVPARFLMQLNAHS
jgi:hypothetical protein